MTEKIPEETIKRVKNEREEDYDKGYDAGVEFAKKSKYSTIDAAITAIKYKDINTLSNHLDPDDPYYSASTEYKNGFCDALEEVLEKSEEEDN